MGGEVWGRHTERRYLSQKPEEGILSLELAFQAGMSCLPWVLETELWSPVRAVHTLRY